MPILCDIQGPLKSYLCPKQHELVTASERPVPSGTRDVGVRSPSCLEWQVFPVARLG